MNHKDFIYNSTFKIMMKEGLTQKQAGDLAARAVNLWTHGRVYKDVMKAVMTEAKQIIKLNKAAKKAKAA
jgi:hypothetical protein